MRGKKSIRLNGLTKNELSNDISMLELKGVGLAQHTNPNIKVSVYVMLSLGKENSATKNDNKNVEEDAFVPARTRKFSLQKVAVQLMKDLREGQHNLSRLENKI